MDVSSITRLLKDFFKGELKWLDDQTFFTLSTDILLSHFMEIMPKNCFKTIDCCSYSQLYL